MGKNIEVKIVPIFEDNYVFVLHHKPDNTAMIVDPGEAETVIEFLDSEGIKPVGILLTHHHHDHIDGAKEIQEKYSIPVYAPFKNSKQIPFADHLLKEGDILDKGPFKFSIIELPGHTLGHIAFWNEEYKWLFSGDVLFGLGCGRLLEGTYEQAFDSLQKIKTYPEDSLIYCTHEYTETNLRFCKALSFTDEAPITGDSEELELYENQLVNRRSLDLPSVPLKLSIEINVNPFLLAKDVAQFTYLREMRNMN